MNQKYDYIIGVDPGTRTGLAIWLPDVQRFKSVETTYIFDALSKVDELFRVNPNILIRIENPNLRKWYGNSGREVLQGAGSIKRDYAIWREFLESMGVPYEDVAPKNLKTKVKAEYFKKLTGWEGRTSSHARDAAMLCFKYQ